MKDDERVFEQVQMGLWDGFQTVFEAFNMSWNANKQEVCPWKCEQMEKPPVFFSLSSKLLWTDLIVRFAFCFSDKRFSALGFGARIPPNYEVGVPGFMFANATLYLMLKCDTELLLNMSSVCILCKYLCAITETCIFVQ